MWRDDQATFAKTINRPDGDLPENVVDPGGRMDVYRNNVAVSLREALAEAFPVVKSLVGEEFFAAMAQTYVRGSKPVTPVLTTYGTDFADFIEMFEPASELPFLSDVARLERLWLDCYHAADAVSLDVKALETVDQDRFGDIVFDLHPACGLFQSDHPVVSIWSEHQGEHAPDLSNLPAGPEFALVIRAEQKVEVLPIIKDFYAFLNSAQNGATLEAALTQSGETDPSALLGALFGTGAVVGLSVSSPNDE